MNLRWTDAGRAALAAAGHAGVAAVKLAHFAIGDGSGPGGEADDSRAALRSERHRAAIAGEAAKGRIALRADLQPDAAYGITEAGIFGTAGDPPSAPQLLLYWTDGGAESGKAAPGTKLALAAVIEFRNAAAEVAVTVGGNIVFGVTEPATEERFGSTRYASAAEAGDPAQGERAVSPKGLHAAAGKVLATLLGSDPGAGLVYQLVGTEDGALAVQPRTQDGATRQGLAAANAAVLAVAGRVGALERAALALPAKHGLYGLRVDGGGSAYERLPFLAVHESAINATRLGTGIAIDGASHWDLAEQGDYLVAAYAVSNADWSAARRLGIEMEPYEIDRGPKLDAVGSLQPAASGTAAGENWLAGTGGAVRVTGARYPRLRLRCGPVGARVDPYLIAAGITILRLG